jgi:hypothetical protein
MAEERKEPSCDDVLQLLKRLSIADQKRIKHELLSDAALMDGDLGAKGDYLREMVTISQMMAHSATSPQEAGKHMERIFELCLLYRYAVEGDQHFPLLLECADAGWKDSNFSNDEARRAWLDAFVYAGQHHLVASGFDEKECRSGRFLQMLFDRDRSRILRGNTQGPGPDLAVWIGEDVLMVVGLKTSETRFVEPSIQAKNYRSTDPEHWWQVNEGSPEGAARRSHAMQALFNNENHPPLRLLVRVHVCIPVKNRSDVFKPNSDFLRTKTMRWQFADRLYQTELPMLDIDIDEKRLEEWTEFLPDSVQELVTQTFCE